MAKNVCSIVDAKGNKLFRVHNFTHAVEHFDGRPIQKFDLQLFADSLDNQQKLQIV